MGKMRYTFLLIFMMGVACSLSEVHGEEAIVENPDSITKLLEAKLDSASFQTEKEIIEYLQLTYQLNQSSPADALIFTKALENLLLTQDKTLGEAHIHSYKGNYYWTQGIYDAALKEYFMALKLFEEQKDEREIIKLLNNIGETYKKQNNYKLAAHFLQRALSKIDQVEGLKAELILVNLGQLYMLQKNRDSAVFFLEKILNAPDISNINALGFAHLYKGIIEREIGAYDSASYHFHKSLEIWEQEDFKRSIAETKAELGQLAIQQENYKFASSILQQAQEDAEEVNALDILMRIFQYQIELSKRVGNKDSLTLHYEKYMAIKDSIFNEEARSEINKLSIQYELSQKDNEYYKLALAQNILTNEIRTRNRFLLFLGVVSLFGFIFIIVLWRQRSSLLKAHEQLKIQKEEIEIKQNEISRKSLELADLNKELYALNTNLEEKIVKRSKQLNRKNTQIAKYTYFNSHKLRAPVASILGLINVLELSQNDATDQVILKYLKSCATELDQIIHNLKNILESEIDEFD